MPEERAREDIRPRKRPHNEISPGLKGQSRWEGGKRLVPMVKRTSIGAALNVTPTTLGGGGEKSWPKACAVKDELVQGGMEGV